MIDESSFEQIAEYKNGYGVAKHDVVSDAECAVLHEPEWYRERYRKLLERGGEISTCFLEGALEGIEDGFKEAL